MIAGNGNNVGEFRALREYTHTLRLKSELFDLRVGYANAGNANCVCIASSYEAHGSPITKGTAKAVPFVFGDPWENRTPVTAVKGRCLSRLTNGPLVAGIGFEPMTYRV